MNKRYIPGVLLVGLAVFAFLLCSVVFLIAGHAAVEAVDRKISRVLK